jgi:hypothetical protein
MEHARLALAALRFANSRIIKEPNLREAAIVQLADDKGYPREIMDTGGNGALTAVSLGALVALFLLRSDNIKRDTLEFTPEKPYLHTPSLETYYGTNEQNAFLNKTLALAKPSGRASTRSIGHEADTFLPSPSGGLAPLTGLPPAYYENVPIGVVGYGAAGLIVAKYLRELGFARVTIFEQRQENAGIWSEKSVYEGSRNNPRDLKLLRQEIPAAPGGGAEVLAVLRRLSEPNVVRQSIKQIVPGDLSHVITTDTGDIYEFPILINACGAGAPRPITDESKMIGPAKHVRAGRWQNPSIKNDPQNGKMFIFVGLGNSTAEMVQVIQTLQDKDVDVDYRILTHYPADAVVNPYDTIDGNDREYRMFRDTSKPNLTSYQGDLEPSRIAYFRALIGGKIISDVKQWEVVKTTGGKSRLGVRLHHLGMEDICEFQELYVLIGYQHSAASLSAMGLQSSSGWPLHDYDGEFKRERSFAPQPEQRLYKGYFGFGSILSSPTNKNAMVIPGMLFRASDLMFGVIVRSIEYYFRQKHQLASVRGPIESLIAEKVSGVDNRFKNRRIVQINIFP